MTSTWASRVSPDKIDWVERYNSKACFYNNEERAVTAETPNIKFEAVLALESIVEKLGVNPRTTSLYTAVDSVASEIESRLIAKQGIVPFSKQDPYSNGYAFTLTKEILSQTEIPPELRPKTVALIDGRPKAKEYVEKIYDEDIAASQGAPEVVAYYENRKKEVLSSYEADGELVNSIRTKAYGYIQLLEQEIDKSVELLSQQINKQKAPQGPNL